jgi:hypothetical protein
MRATVRPASSSQQFQLDTCDVCLYMPGTGRVVAYLTGAQLVAIAAHYLAGAELTAELAAARLVAARDADDGEPLPRRRLRAAGARRLRGLR